MQEKLGSKSQHVLSVDRAVTVSCKGSFAMRCHHMRCHHMATASQTKTGNNDQTTTELAPKLWATANALRGNIDAAEYKHVVLPLMFLKYISDAFEELHEELESKVDEGRDPEQPDEYKERNVFWVPQEARWSIIQSRARQEDIGATIDRAMDVIERDKRPPEGSPAQELRQ